MKKIVSVLLILVVVFSLCACGGAKAPNGTYTGRYSDGDVLSVITINSDGQVTLRNHDKADLFRYTLPYCYDPEAECPLWQTFLERVLPDGDAQLLLAEFIGYCLMPRHPLEKMLLLYGEGLNGKSVTLEVI